MDLLLLRFAQRGHEPGALSLRKAWRSDLWAGLLTGGEVFRSLQPHSEDFPHVALLARAPLHAVMLNWTKPVGLPAFWGASTVCGFRHEMVATNSAVKLVRFRDNFCSWLGSYCQCYTCRQQAADEVLPTTKQYGTIS